MDAIIEIHIANFFPYLGIHFDGYSTLLSGAQFDYCHVNSLLFFYLIAKFIGKHYYLLCDVS